MENNNGGASLLTVLGVIFVVLKCVHVIDWSWWLVTAPFWGPVAFALVIFLVVILGAVALGTRDHINYKRRPKLRSV